MHAAIYTWRQVESMNAIFGLGGPSTEKDDRMEPSSSIVAINCIAFTGNYAERAECPHCGEDRYVDGTMHANLRIHPLTRNTVRAKLWSNTGRTSWRGHKLQGKTNQETRPVQDPHDIVLHMSLDRCS